MKQAIVINHSKMLAELYKDLLELKGYSVQTTYSPREAKPLVEALLKQRLEKVVLLADCCKYYSEHQCMYNTFQAYAPKELSRLRILVTTEHDPQECPLANKTTIPHSLNSNIKYIMGWIDAQ